MLKTIRDLKDLREKRVLLRADFNVQLSEEGDILDKTRILAELPTISYLMDKGAKVIICSHLGRPNGFDKYLSLLPVAVELMQFFPGKVKFCGKTIGEEVKTEVAKMMPGDVLLLENTRFDPREKANDKNFADELASLADYYVNDAFGSCHRKHASTYGVAVKLPSAIGFLIEKELDVFHKALKNPQHPYVAIFGGAKVQDKLSMLSSVVGQADTILIGGGMAYTFLQAKGINVGESIVVLDKVNEAREILKKAEEKGVKIVLPVDHVAWDRNAERRVKTNVLRSGMVGLDIGKKTIKLFENEIKTAKQIIWNGPLGKYEDPDYRKGTIKIARALAKAQADTIVGGGDSVSAINESGVADRISFLSTGGSASLALIEGKPLPALEIIDKK